MDRCGVFFNVRNRAHAAIMSLLYLRMTAVFFVRREKTAEGAGERAGEKQNRK